MKPFTTGYQFQQVGALMEVSVQTIQESIEKITPSLIEFMDKFMGLFWEEYRKAGMPYGESQEGMMRWAGEQREANELEERAVRIRSDHATFAMLRSRRP